MDSTSTPKNAGRRKKLGKLGQGALVLALAGAAVGGGTYATWSQSATASAGTITSGRLAATTGTITNWDVSQDRSDATATAPVTGLKAHSISNLTTYKVVPGDTVQVNIPLNLALEGDNLVANLNLATTAPTTGGLLNTATSTDGVTVTYDVYNAAGTKLTGTPVAWGVDTPYTFQAAAQGGANATGPVVLPATIDATADLTVVVTAKFGDATGVNRQAVTAALGNVVASFSQTRTGTGNGFTA